MSRKRHWLMKTEPDAFSIHDLKRVGTEPWNGVRNYQARNHMRQMHPGDSVLFYHSSCEVPAIVGTAREMVGRTLQEFRRAGIIDLHRGHVVVRDHERLRMVAREQRNTDLGD